MNFRVSPGPFPFGNLLLSFDESFNLDKICIMPQKIRWGILGPGRISRKFATDLRLVENAELVAVGSRSKESAQAFAKEFPVTHVHDSYEALASNPEVDVMSPRPIIFIKKIQSCASIPASRFCARNHLP